jgi:hypothetical protein
MSDWLLHVRNSCQFPRVLLTLDDGFDARARTDCANRKYRVF